MTLGNRLFEAMLSRYRAGESEREILADYGYVPEAELARLRAEVERLKALVQDFIQVNDELMSHEEKLVHDRDKVLAENKGTREQLQHCFKTIQRAAVIIKAAKIFSEKFVRLQDAITSAFLIQQRHGMPYKGETYAKEWRALQAALAAWEEPK